MSEKRNPPSHRVFAVTEINGKKEYTNIAVLWPSEYGGFSLTFERDFDLASLPRLMAAGAKMRVRENRPRPTQRDVSTVSEPDGTNPGVPF